METGVLLRPEEIAYRLGLSRVTIYKLIASGELPSVVIGKSKRVRAPDLEHFIDARRRAKATRPAAPGAEQ